MQLRINQQFAQIGIRTTPPNLQFQSNHSQIEMKTIPAELEIESPKPKIHIDQSQCFADEGLKSPARFAADQVQEGQAGFSEAVQRIVSEGDQFANFQGTSIADIVVNRISQMDEYDVKAVPQQPPEITFETYQVRFSYRPAEIHTSASLPQIDTRIAPGKAETYLLQKNYLQINWVGDNYDKIA